MKLDVNVLRYLSKDEFRVLTAVEMGMKNHEIVPAELVERIAGLKRGGAYKNMKSLLRHKLVHHDSSSYDGYRLTYLGYDFLAIKTLVNRGLITGVGRQIGVGKESDIFEVVTEDGQTLALKLHRLGRTSFRAVKSKRDYLRHRNSYSWLYLSRLAALKEYAFMKALGDHGFSVPQAVDWNRHCVLMTLVSGCPLVQIKELKDPQAVFNTVLGLIVRLAEHGLIHCDFNEFNIMIDEAENITMIDFPQMVSVSHRNAEMYFERDVECIFKFFGKRFNYSPLARTEEDDGRPLFEDVANHMHSLDKDLEASGFTRQNQDILEEFEEVKGGESSNEETTVSEEEEVTGSDSGAEKSKVDVAPGLERLEITLSSEPATGPVDDAQTPTPRETLDFMTSATATGEEVDASSGEDNGELHKRIRKHRHKAVAALHKTKTRSSRNASKDKGGKRSGHARSDF